MCFVKGCSISGAYNWRNKYPANKYCRRHSFPNMVHTSACELCSHLGTFAFPSESGHARRCMAHRLPGMRRRYHACRKASCDRTATWGVDGSVEFCALHKGAWMIRPSRKQGGGRPRHCMRKRERQPIQLDHRELDLNWRIPKKVRAVAQ